jgi:hypothetical protein
LIRIYAFAQGALTQDQSVVLDHLLDPLVHTAQRAGLDSRSDPLVMICG